MCHGLRVSTIYLNCDDCCIYFVHFFFFGETLTYNEIPLEVMSGFINLTDKSAMSLPNIEVFELSKMLRVVVRLINIQSYKSYVTFQGNSEILSHKAPVIG